MNQIKRSIISAVGILMLSMSQLTSATIVTTSCVDANQCSLDELINGDATIGVNDVTFDNWMEQINNIYSYNAVSDLESNVLLDLSSIFVTGIDAVSTGNANEFTLGLQFSGFEITGIDDGDEEEIELGAEYTATAVNGTTITKATLEITNHVFGSTGAFVQAQLDSSLPSIAFETFADTDLNEDLIKMADFAAVTSLDLETNVQLGVFEEGSLGLFSFDVLFTILTLDNTPPPNNNPVPAPASLSIMLLALAGLHLRSRKNSN